MAKGPPLSTKGCLGGLLEGLRTLEVALGPSSGEEGDQRRPHLPCCK